MSDALMARAATLSAWVHTRPWAVRGVVFVALGALAALGQAPWGLWPLSIMALAVIYGLTRGQSRDWLWGWCAGTGYFLLALCWIVEPFMVYPQKDGWMAPFALIFMGAGMGVFWALIFALARRVGGGALGFVAGFVLAEWLRGWIFTGFPWAQIGHIWIDTALLPWAGVGGALCLTLFTATMAVALWNVLIGVRVWGAVTLAACALCWVSAPLFITQPIPRTIPGDGAPVIRLLQPNAAQHEKWDPDKMDLFFTRQIEYSAQSPRPDLVVWPETAVPYLLDGPQIPLTVMSGAAGGAPVIFGANQADGPRYYNALAVLNADAELGAVYQKHHLVPFGEYVPFGDFLARFGIYGLASQHGAGYAAGPGPAVIDIPGIGTAMPLICYEGVFARDVRRAPQRPDFLLMITNDAWFGKSVGPYQHLAQARLRSAEMGLPMVRVANTGVSAMIDASGQIMGALPLGQAGYLDAALPMAHQPTLYALSGDMPLMLIICALLGWAWWRNRRLRE